MLNESRFVPHQSTVLSCQDLRREFGGEGFWRPTSRTVAVDGVSFSLTAGECLGLVGESGSGKSTVGRLMAGLMPPNAGTVSLLGQVLTGLSGRELQAARRPLQMVFQDPFSSLSPRCSVHEILAEPMQQLRPLLSRQEVQTRVAATAAAVGLAQASLGKKPYEFSGGQRQRIAIARALTVRPQVLILDEPTSALDVSIAAQILNLLRDLRSEFQISMLFISHQLGAVAYLADRVAVMQAGRIVEEGDVEQVLTRPHHAYTKELLEAQL